MSVPATIRKSADLPEIFRQLDDYGARFVVYGADKKPRRPNGVLADVTKAATWCTQAEAWAVVGTVQDGVPIVGIGFVLDADRDLAEDRLPVFLIDLDNCLGPDGEPNPDAAKLVGVFNCYTEVSISGGGLHLLPGADPPPLLHRCKLTTLAGQSVEIYRTGRYVALTGNLLGANHGELVDATEAVEELAARVNREGGEKVPAEWRQVAIAGVVADDELIAQIEAEPFAGRRWRNEDGHTDRSSNDYRLSLDLVEANYSHEDIEAALRSFRHGQMGGGKLTGRLADRQICRLIAKAEASTFRSWDDADGWTIWREPDGKVIRIHFERLAENGRRRRAEREAVAMAEVVNIKTAAEPTNGKAKAEPQPFSFWRIADMRLLEPPRFVAGGIVPYAAPSLFFAPSGAFKTTLSVDLVLSIAYRPDWHGEVIPEPFPVIYVANEDRYALARQRVVGWVDHYGIEDERVIVLCDDVLLHGVDVVDRLLTTARVAFPWAERCGFVFDTSDKSINGDPDKASDVLPAMRLQDNLAQESAYVLSAAHTSWGNEDRVKGSVTSWNSYHMRGRITKDPSANIGNLKIIHMKNGPSGQEFDFEYTQHNFDGISTMIPSRIDPAAVNTAAISANALATKNRNHGDAVTALHRAIEAGPVLVPGWAGEKGLQEFVPTGAAWAAWRDQFREIVTKRSEKPIKANHVSSRFEEATRALVKLGIVRSVANVWITRIKPQDIVHDGGAAND